MNHLAARLRVSEMTIADHAQFIADHIDRTILLRALWQELSLDEAGAIASELLETEGWQGRRYIFYRIAGEPNWPIRFVPPTR